MIKWLDADHIKTWGMRQDAIGILPELLQDLVRATSHKSSFVNFPSGKQIFNSGTDGFVNSPEGSEYIPEGISVWELGTRQDIEQKAEGDYKKRTDKPYGYNPSNSTFVFVTPLSWPGKIDWIEQKKQEKKWKDVRAYDCSELAGWFCIAEAVARSYAPIISSYPLDGIQPAKDFWFEWSNRDKDFQLPPQIATSGREFQMGEIRNFLAGEANIKAIRASSRDEAIAFVIASVKQFDEEDQANFFARSLIIDTENNFRSISSKRQSLILISRVEKTQIIHRGVIDGNHVFLTLGGDDIYSGDAITLPQISRDGMIDSLKVCGFSEEEAQKFTRESGNSITILKRLLKFHIIGAGPSSGRENIRTLIPAVLVGRWDEKKEGDKEIVAEMAGEEYEKVIEKLSQWKNYEVPYLYQIGKTWRLTSPLDAWANTSGSILKSDLQRLENISLRVLRNIRPAFDLEPGKRVMASFYGKESTYSGWLREGLVQSLILIALYGSGIELPLNMPPQEWVDSVIMKLLWGAESKLWASLNSEMPLIAEASPISFLASVEKSLQEEKPAILGMFEEEPSLITSQSYHTGLLWALESLAWIPEFLPRVTLILGKLSTLDPGGALSNRPINSLRSVFLPWMPQTFANLEMRDKALSLLVKYEPGIAWKLFISLLPKHHDIAYPTFKTRWRLFGQKNEGKAIHYEEIFKNHSLIVNHLLNITEFNEKKISQLVKVIDELSPKERNKILEFISENKDKIKQVDYSIWHELRQTLGHHRSHPDTNWALSESELINIEREYNELTPTDIINQYKWLFNDAWVEFPKGFGYEEDKHDKQQGEIREKRIEGLKAIRQALGFSAIDELAGEVNEKFIFGDITAYIIEANNDILKFLTEERLSDKDLQLTSGFISRLEILQGFEFVKSVFDDLKQKNYSDVALANFLIPLKQGTQLWNLVEKFPVIENHYWKKVIPFVFNLSLKEKIYVLKKLLSVNRGLMAIEESYRIVGQLPISLILQILEAGIVSKENIRFPGYAIEKIFDGLDKRNDIELSVLANFEWKYLNVFAGSYTRRKPKVLHEELSAKPEFFVDILKLIYRPSDSEESTDNLSEEERYKKASIAHHAYNLLSSWKKLPATDAEDNIDSTQLSDWVKQARDLALKEKRLDGADIHIGKILAHYPENKGGQWPPDIICELIDTINSNAITGNFKAEISNIHGFSSKSPYEGGDRERKLASHFRSLYEAINYKWPVTSGVFLNLAKRYEADAISEDERAKRDALEL